MKINNKKEIINYIINFATSTNIDIIAHLENVQPSDNLTADLENYLFFNGEMDMAAAKKVAMILGINIYDLEHCNEKRLNEYFDSYDFFKLYKAFECQLKNDNDGKVLKLYRFPLIADLIYAYCEMCADYIALLLINISKGCLYNENIELFNFLASVLEARDILNTSDDLLNFVLLDQYYNIYSGELEKLNIMEVIIFKTKWLHELWRCVEFVNDPEIIAKLDRYAPQWRDYVKIKIAEALDERTPICVVEYDESEIIQLSDHDKAVWVYNILELVTNIPDYYQTPQERLLDSVFGEARVRSEARLNVMESQT